MLETLPEVRNRYPHLSGRALGWLRHLHRKAHTPDDWSEDGTPHEWWDRYSTEPTLSFARFDLSESSYALGIMADATPAWREVYAGILEQLIERHLTFWAAHDWLTQFGPDPRRGSYPQEWIDLFIPEHLVGQYDTPGWVANGVEPWGLQRDPIGADGNLFFKGWLNLTQSLHAYVSGEDRWGAPFEVAGVERSRFEWTQHRLVEHLVGQWSANPMGPHCENTKIWPYCLTAAGLGLMLYDGVFGDDRHQTYQGWLDHTRDTYYGVGKDGALEWVTLYYDPLVEHLQATAPAFALALAFYTAPQAGDFAEYLYRAAVRSLAWDDPKSPVLSGPDPRFLALGLATAREFGDDVTEARLRNVAESRFEPRHFGEGEFGFWFNLGENWPRGQLSALAMVAEVGSPGAWRGLFNRPNLEKFSAPTLEGVDYPALGIAQACNDSEAGALLIHTYAGEPARSGERTRFQVTGLPDSSAVQVICGGESYPDWCANDEHSISIDLEIGERALQVYTGYHGPAKGAKPGHIRRGQRLAQTGGAAGARAAGGSPSGAVIAPRTSGIALASTPLCACCSAASLSRPAPI